MGISELVKKAVESKIKENSKSKPHKMTKKVMNNADSTTLAYVLCDGTNFGEILFYLSLDKTFVQVKGADEKYPAASLLYDPRFRTYSIEINKEKYDKKSDAEKRFLLAHNLYHIVYLHGSRTQAITNKFNDSPDIKKKIAKICEVAGDLVVNEFLKRKLTLNVKALTEKYEWFDERFPKGHPTLKKDSTFEDFVLALIEDDSFECSDEPEHKDPEEDNEIDPDEEEEEEEGKDKKQENKKKKKKEEDEDDEESENENDEDEDDGSGDEESEDEEEDSEDDEDDLEEDSKKKKKKKEENSDESDSSEEDEDSESENDDDSEDENSEESEDDCDKDKCQGSKKKVKANNAKEESDESEESDGNEESDEDADGDNEDPKQKAFAVANNPEYGNYLSKKKQKEGDPDAGAKVFKDEIAKEKIKFSQKDIEKIKLTVNGYKKEVDDAEEYNIKNDAESLAKKYASKEDMKRLEKVSKEMFSSGGCIGKPGDVLCPGKAVEILIEAHRQVNKKWESVIKRWTRFDEEEDYVGQFVKMQRSFALFDREDLGIPHEVEVTHRNYRKINIFFFLDTSGSCQHFAPRFYHAASTLDPKRFNVRLFSRTTQVTEVQPGQSVARLGGSDDFSCMERFIQDEIKAGKSNEYPDAVFHITDGGDCNDVMMTCQYPERWHWFLVDGGDRTKIPKGCNIHKLTDFEGFKDSE